MAFAAKDLLAVVVVGGTVALTCAVVAGYVSTDPKLAAVQGTILGFIMNEAKIIIADYFKDVPP